MSGCIQRVDLNDRPRRRARETALTRRCSTVLRKIAVKYQSAHRSALLSSYSIHAIRLLPTLFPCTCTRAVFSAYVLLILVM